MSFKSHFLARHGASDGIFDHCQRGARVALKRGLPSSAIQGEVVCFGQSTCVSNPQQATTQQNFSLLVKEKYTGILVRHCGKTNVHEAPTISEKTTGLHKSGSDPETDDKHADTQRLV